MLLLWDCAPASSGNITLAPANEILPEAWIKCYNVKTDNALFVDLAKYAVHVKSQLVTAKLEQCAWRRALIAI